MNFRIVTNLWLIPAVPFAASLVILSLSKARRKSAAALAVAGQIAALAMSVLAFLPTLQTNSFRVVQNFTWFTFGEEVLRLGFVLDPLAAAMLMMIALVGLCIFVFSIGYMADDKSFTRFFAYLSFFSGAMLGLVIANSLLLLFIFWELVGLASYLLIGFWIERPSAAAAAKKAFITTRIGDMGFFLGMLWLYNRSGTLLFYDGGNGCLESAGLALLGASATFIALLIFCGAVGKSGQFPLHVWLPDAMEGPTPVSALIHAATMVAAGVYMLVRVAFIIQASQPALLVVAWIGTITAVMAALIATQQHDIKRILAYSTLSQLGYMVMAVGLASNNAAMFHLFTHAFFKALLFLAAGSVIVMLHHEQNIWKMGGLRRKLPITFVTFTVGALALIGCPPFSGFFSKDAILAVAYERNLPIFAVALFTAFLTAFYVIRMLVIVFFGNPRSYSAHEGRESPPVMTWPLVVLAILATLGGFGFFARNFLALPVENGVSNLVPALAIVALILGGGLAFAVYRGRSTEVVNAELLRHKFYFDEFYSSLIYWTQELLARVSAFVDRWIIDAGAVGGTSRGTWGVGALLRLIQVGDLQA
ncbi:MAG: NADH-quinone oxidoreductase subunit L, partial [Verrucomicrobia bacterium]